MSVTFHSVLTARPKPCSFTPPIQAAGKVPLRAGKEKGPGSRSMATRGPSMSGT